MLTQQPTPASTADAKLASSPLPYRMWLWMLERFPPSHAVLFAMLYITAVQVGRGATAHGQGALVLSVPDIIGFGAAYAFFLMLRIFDEHKDFAADAKFHPNRVLQRGLIRLSHLKILGVAAIATQAGISVWLDASQGPVLWMWGATFAWSVLMALEFFVSEWLGKRLFVYAISHMLVMPLAMAWMAAIGGASLLNNPAELGTLMLLSFVSGFAFEIARKTRAPADERHGVDSYTKVFGTQSAPRVTLGFLTVGAICVTWLCYRFAAPQLVWLAIPVAIAWIFAARTLYAFSQDPGSKKAKACEGIVSLSMLLSYSVVLTALGLSYGFGWV